MRSSVGGWVENSFIIGLPVNGLGMNMCSWAGAAVDATTGQLLLYVRVPNGDRTLAAGLFAEGRVAIQAVRGLAIPIAALDARSSSASVKRIRGGKVEVVAVTLGLRDELADRIEVTSGLSRGDTVLVGAAIGTPAGASVRFGAQDN